MPTSRLMRFTLAALILLALLWFGRGCWQADPQHQEGESSSLPISGGVLNATYSTEPNNFLRVSVPGTAPNQMVNLLTQATLLRTGASGELEPRLATTWSSSDDRLVWTLALHPAAKFSDGTPVTAADVVFSVRAVLGTPAAADLRVNGQPIAVRALDDHQVVVTLPAPHGPGIAILENLPVLPRHRLEPAVESGTLPTVWATTVNPTEVVGAGPFMLAEYVPGQRLRFVRNPHFFGRDDRGTPLPYLDEIRMSIVPEHNTELLRLQSGDTDVITNFANAEDLAVLRRSEADGRVTLRDVGPSIDGTTLWFNLRPDAPAAATRPWLVRPEFRRAISHAVNRQAIVDTVFLGEAIPAFGPVTPAYGQWFVPDLPVADFDQVRARTLLTSMGLVDRDNDGILDDASNQPVRFSIITRSGQPERERTVAVVQEQLRQVGIAVDIQTMTQQEIIARYSSGEFDAIYYGVLTPSRDPNSSMAFWLSSGQFHWWHPGQTTPATEWEDRIDTLMREQAASIDPDERRRLFGEAQHILAEQMPALWFVARRAFVVTSRRVQGVTPIVFFPPVLWNAERLYLVDGGQ